MLLLLAVTVGIGFWSLGDELTLSKLATREAVFRQYQTDHPVLIYLFAFVIYVTVTGLSLPGATPLQPATPITPGFDPLVLPPELRPAPGAPGPKPAPPEEPKKSPDAANESVVVHPQIR